MTRQQQWAKEALKRVENQIERATESKYRTLCVKMPSLLKQSGLVQSLAFMRARSGDEGKAFCNDLAEVYGISKKDEKSAGAVLQDRAQIAALPEYLILSRDLIEVSIWFRRFAQSELKEEDDVSGESTDGAPHADPA